MMPDAYVLLLEVTCILEIDLKIYVLLIKNFEFYGKRLKN